VTYDSTYNEVNIAYMDCNNGYVRNSCALAWQQIASGATTLTSQGVVGTYSYPEAEANRPFFQPLFGDYIGAIANTSSGGRHTIWFGITDTLRSGLYGYGKEYIQESNNSVRALDYP
jgi:hypothetical protein